MAESAVRLVEQTFECKIRNFLMQPKEKFNFSQNFSFANNKWYLGVFSNAREENNSVGWISLHLFKCGSPNEPRVSFTLGIKKPDDSVYHSLTQEHTFTYFTPGPPELILGSKFLQNQEDFTSDGTLTVFCTMRLADSSDTASHTEVPATVDQKEAATQATPTDIDKEDAATRTLSSEYFLGDTEKEAESQLSSSKSEFTVIRQLKDLFISGLHSDVRIKTKDRVFQAHKCVLTARSQVFAAMFDHEMAEKTSGVVDISDDPNVDPDSFQDFLLFMYSGAIDHVSPTNAIGLYRIADKYNTEELKEPCVTCLECNMSVDSICDVIHLATVHDETELLATATDFFIHNLSAIFRTQKWKDFLLEYISIANELLIKMADRKPC